MPFPYHVIPPGGSSRCDGSDSSMPCMDSKNEKQNVKKKSLNRDPAMESINTTGLAAMFSNTPSQSSFWRRKRWIHR